MQAAFARLTGKFELFTTNRYIAMLGTHSSQTCFGRFMHTLGPRLVVNSSTAVSTTANFQKLLKLFNSCESIDCLLSTNSTNGDEMSH